MSREFPDCLDPWKAAEGERFFAGTIPFKRMPRLQPLLGSDEGAATFEAQFTLEERRWPCINLEVEAEVPVICQRSLNLYCEAIKRSSVIAIIKDQTEETLVRSDFEPVLIDNGRLSFADLVEEEILLSLPQVPRDPEYTENSMDNNVVEVADSDSRKPFAELAALLEPKRN